MSDLSPPPARLTLGPVLFNWPAAIWHDFYARIADEAPVDRVYLGEIVCAKRAPFFADVLPAVIDRLRAAGKEVVLSSPILVTTERERSAVRDLTGPGLPAEAAHDVLVEAAHDLLVEAAHDLLVEANDLGAVALLAGRPHTIGPFVNTYNEATLTWLAEHGARAITLPPELPATAIATLAAAAAPLGVAIEVQVFGRMPLAISARCYHARAHGLHKDGCQFVCANDADGLAVDTLDGQPFLAINGLQTLSHACLALTAELPGLRAAGVTGFRLSPQSCDMVAVARAFRAVLDGQRTAAALAADLAGLNLPAPLANGFYHGRAGAAFAAGAG